MAYQVLARKWRPQTFEAVVGQEPITRTLQNALAAGRVAHAFLFSGPRGVGKTSVARIMAKALNCAAGPTPNPDNTCQMCREITNGSSLDVLEIDGASNRGIDEVRDLREKIKYLPTQGKYKVYIIDEVHMLTKEAFNALLKTLEEPPAHAVFILATTEVHKVPVTILSRCQRYDFRRIPTPLIQAHLAKLAQKEGWQLDSEGLALVARAAEGSLRDAQGFLDQVVTFGGEGVSVDQIARILGVTDRAALLGALTAIIDRKGPDLLNLIEALYNQGQDLGRFYQDLILYARHLLVAGLHPEARPLAAVADTEWEELTRLASRTPAVHLHNRISVLLQGEEELKRAPQPRLALEVLLLRVIHLEPLLSLDEWLRRLDALEQRLETGLGSAAAGVGEPQPLPVIPGERAPAASPPGSPGEAGLHDQWQAFLNFVQEKENGPLSGRLAQSRLVDRSDHCLKIALGRAWNAAGPRHEARLRELARAYFGPETTLELEPEAPQTTKKSPATAKKPQDLKKIRQQALEIFGGEWVGATPGKEEPE
jgi:DNA polymerase-3 subunit gamma/tau